MNYFLFDKRRKEAWTPPIVLILRTMKITTFLLLAFMTCAYAEGTAQKVTLSLKNAKLEDAFRQISKQTNLKFLYNDEVITKSSPVNLDVRGRDVQDVLDMMLPEAEYSFKVIAGTVTVNYREKIPKVKIAALNSQNTVTGRVTTMNGEPLVGVSVSIKGTSQGTSTDEDGNFSISAKINETLVVRYVGYHTKEIIVNDREIIAVILDADDRTIEAVDVVATGYQNLDRKLFTGASTRVLAKDAERAGVPDISRMLEGQAAGVSVQNVSGTFGAAPKIRVRGATSLSGENKPLWVIDGIVLEDIVNISNEALSTGDANTLIGSSVAGLNPDDIESLTILKDAAATAMYGARAMNGVVVVTTKKGRNTEGKPHVNYSGTFTTYLKPNYDQFDIMNSAEQMSIMMEMENKGYFNHSGVSRAANGGVFYKMYNLMYDYDPVTEKFALRNTMADRLNFLQRYAQANTDWFDVLFNNSLLQEHSINIASGTARHQTYFSTGFMHDNGQTLGDNVKRYTANFRNTFKVSDKLTAEFIVNGSIRDQRTPGTLTRQSDPVYGKYSRDFDINPYSYALNTSRLITPYDEYGNLEYFTRNYAGFNIVDELDKNYLNLNMMDLKVQARLDYNIFKDLRYSVSGAYRYANSDRKHYVREGANMAETFRAAADETIREGNTFLYADPNDPNAPKYIVLPDGGFLNTTLDNLKNYYFRNDLVYDLKLTDHQFNLFGSMEIKYVDRQNTDYQGVGYQYEMNGLVDANYRYFKKMSEGGESYFGMYYDRERYVATMFRAAYAYKEKYAINGTVRYDGSNQMGRSRSARWLPTWNISGKWNLDQESFFNQDQTILTGAAVRATYGMTGSLNRTANSGVVYNSRITYRPWESEKESMILIGNNANRNLTWEKLYEFNVGADLAFLNNNIFITADWYKRKSFDLIGRVRTSGVEGEYTKYSNYADLVGQGFEFTISGSPVKSESGFNWLTTQFNFAINKNEVRNLEVNPNVWELIRAEGAAREGYAQRGMFSLAFDGLNSQYGYPTYIGTEGVKDSYVYLQSQDVDYLYYHGPVDPTFTGGFYNNFGYKGFNLSFLFTFATGNYVRLQPTFSSTYDDMTSMSKDMVNRWLMPGDEKITNIPSIVDPLTAEGIIQNAAGGIVNARYPYNAYNYSTERVAKGDFARLKTVSLSYILPSKLVSRIGLNSLRVSLVGNNVALLYSDKKLNGADPEFFNNGGVAMPVPRQYTLSLKAGF